MANNGAVSGVRAGCSNGPIPVGEATPTLIEPAAVEIPTQQKTESQERPPLHRPNTNALAEENRRASPDMLVTASQLIQQLNQAIAALLPGPNAPGRNGDNTSTQGNEHHAQCARVEELQKELNERLNAQPGATGTAAHPENHQPDPANDPAHPTSPPQSNTQPDGPVTHPPVDRMPPPGQLTKGAENIRTSFGGRAGTLAMAGLFGMATVGGLALLFAAPLPLFVLLFGLAITAEMAKPVREFQADMADRRDAEALKKKEAEAEAKAEAEAQAEPEAEAEQPAAAEPPAAPRPQTATPLAPPLAAGITPPVTVPAQTDAAVQPAASTQAKPLPLI
jgi:hypothetical protein